MGKPMLKTDGHGKIVEDNRPGATTIHVLEKDALAQREERFTQGVERIAEVLERYVDEKIESDKVLIGLLNDMNLRQEMESKIMTRENEGQGVTAKKTEASVGNRDDLQLKIAALERTSLEDNKRINEILQKLEALESKKIDAEALSEDRRLN